MKPPFFLFLAVFLQTKLAEIPSNAATNPQTYAKLIVSLNNDLGAGESSCAEATKASAAHFIPLCKDVHGQFGMET